MTNYVLLGFAEEMQKEAKLSKEDRALLREFNASGEDNLKKFLTSKGYTNPKHRYITMQEMYRHMLGRDASKKMSELNSRYDNLTDVYDLGKPLPKGMADEDALLKAIDDTKRQGLSHMEYIESGPAMHTRGVDLTALGRNAEEQAEFVNLSSIMKGLRRKGVPDKDLRKAAKEVAKKRMEARGVSTDGWKPNIPYPRELGSANKKPPSNPIDTALDAIEDIDPSFFDKHKGKIRGAGITAGLLGIGAGIHQLSRKDKEDTPDAYREFASKR